MLLYQSTRLSLLYWSTFSVEAFKIAFWLFVRNPLLSLPTKGVSRSRMLQLSDPRACLGIFLHFFWHRYQNGMKVYRPTYYPLLIIISQGKWHNHALTAFPSMSAVFMAVVGRITRRYIAVPSVLLLISELNLNSGSLNSPSLPL